MKKKFVFVVLSFLFSVYFYSLETNIDSSTSKNILNENDTERSKIVDPNDFIPNVQLALSCSDYMVTAGDVYSLNYTAGNTSVSYMIGVDPTYRIRVANLAVLDGQGKSYVQLKKEVEEIVQKNYPMSGVQFKLATPAVFKVLVIGEVRETTEKQVWSLTRLSSVVQEIKTDYSSDRCVTIKSINGKTKNYDLYKALRYGDLSQNPYLRPGDVITLNRCMRKVSVNGAVERPGVYELLEGENLKKLVNDYSSGVTPLADLSRIEVTRKLDYKEKSGKKIYLTGDCMEEDFQLLGYDKIYIPTYENLKPVIFLEGAISEGGEEKSGTVLETNNKIAIRFENGTDLSSCVRLYSDYFISISDLKNAYIIRGDEIIPQDLTLMLYDQSYYSEFIIENNDILRVPFKQYFVTVGGSVAIPGRYPYIPDRTYDYYIGLAGGFLKSQNSRDAVIITDIDGNELKKTDIITPETKIVAKTNSGTYYFNQYAGVISTILGVISTTITTLLYFKQLKG